MADDQPFLMHEGRPLSAARFAADYWSNRMIHCRIHPDVFPALQDFSEIDDVLSRQTTFNISKCLIRSQEEGYKSVTSPALAAEGLSKGLTLQVRNLENYLTTGQPLLRFARALETASGNPLGSLSMFITPAHSQATPDHLDPTEIFTVQLAGSKRWKYNPTRHVEDADPNTYLTAQLHAGDFFYLPSGHAHFAAAEDEPSISAALVYKPHKFELLLRHLTGDPKMRQLLNRGIPAPMTEAGQAALLPILAEFLTEFRTRLGEMSVQDFAAFLLETARVSLPPPRILSLTGLADTLNENTRFERDKDQAADLYLSPDSLKVALKGGVNFTAPRFLEQEVRWILARDLPFTAADVSKRMTAADAMKLLKKLHHLGVVKTVAQGSAAV